MLPISIPNDVKHLLPTIQEIIRRAKDATVGEVANSIVLAVGTSGNYARLAIDDDYALVVTPLTGTGINQNINVNKIVLPVGSSGNFARVEINDDYSIVVTPI